MTCITYTREMHYGSEMTGEAEVARCQVTEYNLRRWECILAFGKEHNLADLEAWTIGVTSTTKPMETTKTSPTKASRTATTAKRQADSK